MTPSRKEFLLGSKKTANVADCNFNRRHLYLFYCGYTHVCCFKTFSYYSTFLNCYQLVELISHQPIEKCSFRSCTVRRENHHGSVKGHGVSLPASCHTVTWSQKPVSYQHPGTWKAIRPASQPPKGAVLHQQPHRIASYHCDLPGHRNQCYQHPGTWLVQPQLLPRPHRMNHHRKVQQPMVPSRDFGSPIVTWSQKPVRYQHPGTLVFGPRLLAPRAPEPAALEACRMTELT